MDVRTYRARTMQEALHLVRRDLGPNAAVLQTRDVRAGGLFRLLPGMRRIEVTASAEVTVPSRLPKRMRDSDREQMAGLDLSSPPPNIQAPMSDEPPGRQKFREELKGQLTDLQSMVEDLCRRSQSSTPHDLPRALFHLFTDLIEADVSEELARELVERIRVESPGDELADEMLAKARIARMVEDEIHVNGPIAIPPGRRRLVALVGPTGVGKTTTIASWPRTIGSRKSGRSA